jgi:4-amino-4-deoxy-L-arabinose transferase-like glycosyltransferase
MLKFKYQKFQLYIILLGIVLFFPFLGGFHLFDWDEINFAESAREMIVSGNYLDVQINFHAFWEKPPLFIWMQVLSMKIFGINEFAARFPNAVCGILTMLVLFNTGRKFRDEKFGWIWVMCFACSLLPFAYFRSGIIDPWFNLFIFLGIINFVYYLINTEDRIRKLIMSAFFLGLAVLTKGPAALVIFTLSFIVYLFFVRFRIKTNLSDILIFTVILSLTGGFWFILQILSGNIGVIRDFIVYQIRLFKTEDAGHGGFAMYHSVVLFFGVFPASVFAIFAFLKKAPDKSQNTDFTLWMQILFFVVLILFSIVKTKIVHYSSMCYFPLTFIAALSIWKIISGELQPGRWFRLLLLICSVIPGILLVLISTIDVWKGSLISKGWISDSYTLGNLQASGSWTGFEHLGGIIFIFLSSWFVFKMRKNAARSITGIFVSTLAFVFLLMTMVTPRIEAYSQRAAIEFYKEVADEDVYITTLGFKSYANLFYGQVKPFANKTAYEKGWLLAGKIDKRVYIVLKISRKDRYLKEYPDLQILYEKNGFVFAKREPF